MEWENQSLQVNTYKIADDNYVYAMFKLGQFYTLVNIVLSIHNISIPGGTNLGDIVDKIAQHIDAARDVMEYQQDNDTLNIVIL